MKNQSIEINRKTKNKGFTLIEMMTALTIFAIVMTISMGSIIGIFDANRKSNSLKTVMDNMNFTLESISRETRFGKNYHCELSGGTINVPLTSPQNCQGGTILSFLSVNDNRQLTYKYNEAAQRIEKSTDGGITFIPVTSPEVKITSVNFTVVGAGSGDGLQPKLFILLKGYAGNKPSVKTDFVLQTEVSQRALDN